MKVASSTGGKRNGSVRTADTPGSCEDFLSSVAEAVAAVNRTVASGLEGNLAGRPALGADSVEHLTRGSAIATAARSLTSVTASLAALRLIGETFFGIKGLLIGSENELLAAVFASDDFVVVHLITSISLDRCPITFLWDIWVINASPYVKHLD